MPPGLEAARSVSSFPIFDIAGLSGGDRAERLTVQKQLRQACLDKGFFYVKNHGVPEELVTRIFSESEKFFALPEQQKLASDKALSGANRGYEPQKKSPCRGRL